MFFLFVPCFIHQFLLHSEINPPVSQEIRSILDDSGSGGHDLHPVPMFSANTLSCAATTDLGGEGAYSEL